MEKSQDSLKKIELKKKVYAECENCLSSFIYFRKDGSYFCRGCGYDSRKKEKKIKGGVKV
jgi:ribosomal protein L37AE/L43A